MEQALKRLLLTGGIGEQLLEPDSLHLLNDVKHLREKEVEAKNALQDRSKEQIQINKDVLHMQEMLSVLQDLTSCYRKDVEIEVQGEKDMTLQVQGHLRHQCSDSEMLNQLSNTVEYLQNQILLREREVNDLQKMATSDGQLLQELLDHLSKNEEDNLLLLQYTAAEASEMKKLSVTLEKLSEEVSEAERHYRECEAEANACKTARAHLLSSFLKEAQQRDELLVMWEATLDQLKEKNAKETTILEEMFLVRSRISSLRLSRDQEDYLLNQIRSSVEEIKRVLEALDKESPGLAENLASVLEATREIRGQVNELENCELKIKSEISHLRTKIKTTNEMCKEKKTYWERLLVKCSKLEENLQLESELLLSSEQSLRALETIKTETTRQNLLLEKQIEVIRNLKQRHLREITNLEQRNRTDKGTISAFNATKIRTKKDTKNLEAKCTKCENLIYSQELELEETKSRIHKLTHDDNNNPLNEDLRKSVDTIKERIFENSQNVLLLQRTIPLLQSRLLKSVKESELRITEVSSIEEEISSVMKENEVAEREKVRLLNMKEECSVDISLVELQLQNRVQKLREVQDEVSRVKQNTREVEQLMKEERESIRGALMATKSQIRDLEGRQAAISKQLHFVNANIEQLKEKFDRIRQAVNAPEGELDISPVHVMLEIAKEREGLQEAGDMLDVEVRNAEEEIEGLQKILSLLNLENDEFRSKLHHLIYHNEEDAQKGELECKLESIKESIAIWKELYKQETQELLRENEHFRETELQLHAVEELLREKNMHVRAIERELGNQKIRMEHAIQACTSLKAKLNNKNLKLVDIELRIYQERLRVVTSLIGEEINGKPEIAEACVLYCQQENVPPPNISRLTRRSDYGSRSSLGSVASSKGSNMGTSHTPAMSSAGPPIHKRFASTSSVNSQDSGSSSVALGDAENRAFSSRETRNIPRLIATPRCPDPSTDLRDDPQNKRGQTTKKKKSPHQPSSATNSVDKKLLLIRPEFPGWSARQKIESKFKGSKILRRPSFRS